MSPQIARLSALLTLVGAACSTGRGADVPTGTGGTGVVRCTADVQCPGGACLGGNCILYATIAPTWTIEILPPGNSVAPRTEVTNLPAASGPLSLSTDATIELRVTFNAVSADAVPAPATVVLSVPSLIGGQPDLTFETGVNTNALTFVVPESVLARKATVDLIPASPADQQSPPFSFTIDTLAQNNNLTIPSNSLWLRGVLHDAIDRVPSRAFVARAYQRGRLVSNVSIVPGSGSVGADGSFRLAIPAALAMNPVSVQLWPQGTAQMDPWFISNDWSLANLDMGVITLPAYQTPQTFSVPITGDHGEAIAGALVSAATELTPQAGGTTRFSTDGVTKGDGTVALPMIPGTATSGRSYDLAIVPLPGTPFGFACAPRTVFAGGADSSSAIAVQAIKLTRRPLVSGIVTNAVGSPVPNVTVTANRAPETAGICAMTSAPAIGPISVSTTTNAVGAFILALDAGAYQIDYDPPEGSWTPRLTEYNVAVNDMDVRLPTVMFPPPQLIAGQVSDVKGKPLANTTIRVFEPRCDAGPTCKTPPILRGATLTDDEGNFRMVVAMPPMPAN